MKKLSLIILTMKNLPFIVLLFAGAITANANFNSNELKLSKEVTTTEVIKRANVSPFCMAIVKGDFETVKKLIDMGADIDAKSNGLTPLMYAAKFNRTDILELLISKGANLKARDSKKGYTALKFAELSNATEAKEILERALNA
ncbi:ankyrin repeat domain-containing protein [Abyssalbus ytuae]|uniref:Ankyrin repeat domain-containing protein n=1 Tax=Abyssalbus ytuae TaxID=2926907 RepID=A0A9E7D0E0_9FLAO|nr:ankyrin repeat domain-containing protein [Abyssalbus ytuae]UOB18340.1 ankyrin repeat domain-containing protein [Abyssalbus ytuae]